MSRPDITETVLSLMHRPPAQRNLAAERVDVPEAGSGGRARTEQITREVLRADRHIPAPDDRPAPDDGLDDHPVPDERLAADDDVTDDLTAEDEDEVLDDVTLDHVDDLRIDGLRIEHLRVEHLKLEELNIEALDIEALDGGEFGPDDLIDEDSHADDLDIDSHRGGSELGIDSDSTDNDLVGSARGRAADSGQAHGLGTARGHAAETARDGGPATGRGRTADRSSDRAGTTPQQNQAGPRVDPRLVALAEMNATDPRHGSLRRTVIEAHLPLVHHLAQRFRGRGEPYDDLVQVGTIGLLHAVDRYDPGRGSFAAFAVPTIVGEIRRHFRDRGWALRIPRRVQDLGRRVSEARETLTHGLDRSPTVGELATYLQVDADLVLEALETASAYITVPLPITADESDRMARAFEDSGLELVEQRETLRPLLAQLPVRQQRILEMRFFRGMSQSQIASEIGVSQMHVSRLLAKSLAALRSGLTEEL